MATPARPSPTDVAVVGMACRFPGDATDTEGLWRMLQGGENAWSEPPPNRFSAKGWYHPDPNRQGSFHIRGAHFLKDDIAGFDAPFFSVSTSEANSMDPQQRFLLEVTYEALENAGMPIKSLEGSETGVWCGSFVRDYEQPCMRDADSTPLYAATGTGIAILANRISHAFDLAGTSQTIDTGCSASLVCVHQACRSLVSGESSLAIAAGVGLIFSPNTMVPMAGLNIMSPDGRCFTFDERANGYGRGEGIGVVVLKRVEDAIRDNDTIRAVIRGTRSNQDGRTQGITLPSKERQIANISGLYRTSGLDVDRTAYVECHGTGTQAGDFLELHAVSESLCQNRLPENPILVSSIKPNIGHLEGSAGVAGLIKGVLVVEKGFIPKHCNFEIPNSRVDFEALKVKVPRTTTPWPVQGLRRASVNSFGFGGTNAHAVLDDAAHYMSEHSREGHHNTFLFPDDDLKKKPVPSLPQGQLYVFSGYDTPALRRVLTAQTGYIQSHLQDANFAANYAYTLSSRRSKLDTRTFVVAHSPDELLLKLEKGETAQAVHSPRKPPRIAFVFCGQGAQWYAMGRELLQYDVFRKSIDAASHYLKSLGSAFWLAEELERDEQSTRVNRSEIAQPATTAIQVALVELLGACNVTPATVVGHSSGEIAAAYAMGAITRENAWKIAYHRGRCAATLEQKDSPKGAMLAAALGEEAAQGYLTHVAPGSVAIACVNGPVSVTFSGDEEQIVRLQELLVTDGVRATRVNVNVAYHSHQMLALAGEYREAIRDVKGMAASGTVAMYSSAYGRRVSGEELNGEYWVHNLCSPVLFYDAVSQMTSEVPVNTFIEVGPTRVWDGTIFQILGSTGRQTTSASCLPLLSKGRSSTSTFIEALGHLWCASWQVQLDLFFSSTCAQTKPKALVDLPAYPWDHSRRFWHESKMSVANRFRPHGREDLLGAPLENVDSDGPIWRGFFRLSENPWLADHVVEGTIVYPAGGMLAMAVRAGEQLAALSMVVEGLEIKAFEIIKPIIIPTTAGGVEHIFSTTLIKDYTYDFRISTRETSSTATPEDEATTWTLHAKGTLKICYARARESDEANSQRRSNEEYLKNQYLQALNRCAATLEPRQLYEKLDNIGMIYGDQFRNITELASSVAQRGNRDKNLVCSTIVVHDTKVKMPKQFEFDYLIHPTTLDAMMQTVLAMADEPMLPTSISSVYISASIPRIQGSRLVGFAEARRLGWRVADAQIVFFDGQVTRPVVIINDARFRSLPESVDGAGYLPTHRNLCSRVAWTKDVELSRPTDLDEFLEMLAHKKPTLRLLFLNTHENTKIWASQLLETGYRSPRFAQCVICPSLNRQLDGVGNVFTPSYRDRTLFTDDEDMVFESRYDIIFVNASRIHQLGSICNSLVPNGRIILEYDGVPSKSLRQDVDKAFLQVGQGVSDIKPRYGRSKKSFRGKHLVAAWRPPTGLGKGFGPSAELVVVLPKNPSAFISGLGQDVCHTFSTYGMRVEQMCLDEAVTLQDSDSTKAFVSLLEFEGPLVFTMRAEEFESLHKLLSVATTLVWVTKAGRMDQPDPRIEAFRGLARTLRSEDANRKLITINVEATAPVAYIDVAKLVAVVYAANHGAPEDARVQENEYWVDHCGDFHIPRLVSLTDINSLIEKGPSRPDILVPGNLWDIPQTRLVMGSVGSVDGPHFYQGDAGDRDIEAHEIRIAVMGTHLEPHDTATIKGDSFEPIGGDVYGMALVVGRHVRHIRQGSLVVALHRGVISTVVCVPGDMVRTVPDTAAPPTSYSLTAMATASYGIGILDIPPQGTIVIFGAASPAGQMAALATRMKWTDSQIVLACEGPRESEIARAANAGGAVHLLSILDVSDDGFVERVLQLTWGKGADAALNSTARHTEEMYACIKDGGCVSQVAFSDLEIAQRAHQAKKVLGQTFDIRDVLQRDQSRAKLIFDNVDKMMASLACVGIKGQQQFPYRRTQAAFAALVEAPYTGLYTLVVNPDDELPVAKMLTEPITLPADGAYLLVGGLGGLGRSIAQLLVDHMAKTIVFINRSAPDASALAFIASLSSRATIYTFQADVSDRAALAAVFDEMARAGLRLRGAFQCAAVLDDAAFANMSYDRWMTAFAPKALGAWNLHSLLPADLDFFIMLSSSSGVIGNRGQANYASGNAFQDGLALHRTALGRPTFSLDLGLVLEAGMVARDASLLDRMRAAGFFGTRLADVHFLVLRAMAPRGTQDPSLDLPPQTVTAVGTGGLALQVRTVDPFWTRAPLFAYLNTIDAPPGTTSATLTGGGGAHGGPSDLASAVRGAQSLDAAAAVLLPRVTARLAHRKGMLADEVDPGRSFAAYGIDSLDSIFLLGWISRELGAGVQTLDGLTIAELCAQVASKVRAAGAEEANAVVDGSDK